MKETAYICSECRLATKHKATHPGVRHIPGICDCPCRGDEQGRAGTGGTKADYKAFPASPPHSLPTPREALDAVRAMHDALVRAQEFEAAAKITAALPVLERAVDLIPQTVQWESLREELLAASAKSEAHEQSELAALRAEVERLAPFVDWLLEHFWDGPPDECDMVDKAVECGLIVSVPGGFDPDKHHDPSGCCEPGDEFFEYTRRAALEEGTHGK